MILSLFRNCGKILSKSIGLFFQRKFKMIEENFKVNEASFARLVKNMKEKDFAILTAFRDNFSSKENRGRNRELISKFLRPKGIGPTMVKGAWEETQDDGSKKEVAEDSLFFVRPDNMSPDAFQKLVLDIIKEYNQDGAVLKLGDEVNILDQSNSKMKIGSKTSINPGKLGQAFSRVRGKTFQFEGVAEPKNHIQGLLAQHMGLVIP